MQGVGFREALRAEALRLCLSGWVRNRADGSVEALLQGDDAAVDRLIAWAHRGPPLAQVHTVDVSAAEPGHERIHQGFERRASA